MVEVIIFIEMFTEMDADDSVDYKIMISLQARVNIAPLDIVKLLIATILSALVYRLNDIFCVFPF